MPPETVPPTEPGPVTVTAACPKCGHSDDDHRRESWYDEEGIEGMTCATCEDAGRLCSWWTWDWADVVAQTVMHQGDDDA